MTTPTRSNDPAPGVLSASAPRHPEAPTWLLVGAALAASVPLGFWVSRDPSLLHVDVALTPGSLVPLVLVLGMAAAVLRFPGVGVVLLVAAVYLNLSEVLVRHHGFPSILQILALPLLLAALVERSDGARRASWGPHLLLGLLAVHVLAVLASTTVAVDRALADERLVETVKGFSLVVLLVLLLDGRRRIRAAAWTLLGGGALLAGLAVLQAATGSFANDFGGLARIKHAHIHGNVFQPRIAGPLGDPNYFAQILLVLVPVALFSAWEESRARLRVLALGAAGLIVAATVLTYSRGGAIALGVVLLFSLLVRGMNVRRLAGGLVVLLALGYLLPRDFTQRLATVTEIVPGQEETVLERDSSFEERLLLGGVAWQMFRAQPVLGVGAGNYTVHFDDYVDRVGSAARDYGGSDEVRYPHNLYLELGAEGGVAALLSFLAVMGATLVLLHRARRRYLALGDRYMAGLAAALAVALAGYLTSSVFLHGHHQRYLWLLVGLSAALYATSLRPGARNAHARPTSPPDTTPVGRLDPDAC